MSERIEIRPIALAIIEREGKLLVAQRHAGAEFGGLWEFPGGKIEPGETAEQAAVREGLEELGCRLKPTRLLCVHEHRYADFIVRLHAIGASLEPGATPEPRAAARLRWLTPDRLAQTPMPEANRGLLDKLRSALAP